MRQGKTPWSWIEEASLLLPGQLREAEEGAPVAIDAEHAGTTPWPYGDEWKLFLPLPGRGSTVEGSVAIATTSWRRGMG